MRLGEALVGACAALGALLPAIARADAPHDAPSREASPGEAPLPPLAEARPPLPPPAPPAPLPWDHHLEFGAGFLVSELPVHLDGSGKATPIRFAPAPGFLFDLSWQVIRYLRFTGYLYEHAHTINWNGWNATGVGTAGSITGPDAHMYSFGVRLSPMLPIGNRVRLWLTVGAGFGHIAYGSYTSTGGSAGSFTIFARDEDLFEIPLGVGASFTIIPRWFSLFVEATGAFAPSQIGPALDMNQVIAKGQMQNLGPMPKLDASFVESIGLAIHL